MSLENTHDIGNIKIVMLGGSGGATALSDLTDTNISNPASGQVLKYNGLKWANGDIVSGLGIGKKTSVSNNTIITDIDLHREPIAGDRLLIFFDTTVQNPTGLTTYNNGTAVTKNLENVSPLYYNAGWNVAEFKNDGLLYNNVWVRVQNVPVINYNAGSGISISNNTIVNTRRGALTGAIDSISSGYAHVLMNGARDTFAAGALIVVQSEASGSATNLRIQYGSQASDSQDFRFYDTEGDTLSLSISSGNTIIAMIDSTGYRAIVLKVLDIEAQVGEPVRELRKLKIDGVVYDTDGMRTYEASNVANNNITLSVLNAFQFVQKVIAINTGAHSGSSSAWNLVISDGMEVASVALKNADGSPFADDIHENELLFVYVDTAGNVARVLEIHSHDVEVLKDICITEKTVSGNPIVITDALPYNAVSLSAEIEASQDLHGYDKPWVGGAGKNKLEITASAEIVGNLNATIDRTNGIITVAGGQTISGSVFINVNIGNFVKGGTWKIVGVDNGSDSTYFGLLNMYDGDTYKENKRFYNVDDISTSYDINYRIYFASGYTVPSGGLTFKPMICTPADYTADPTFAPYSNICPISGRTAVVVNDAGQNLFSKVFVDDSHYLKNDGTTAYDANFHITEFIPVSANTDYILSGVSGNNSPSICVYDANYNFLFGKAYSGNPTVTINTGASGRYVKFSARTDLVNSIMLECGTQKSPSYIPYTGNVNVTIQLGQTVYGGTLNVTTGVMTVTDGMVDLGDLTWTAVNGSRFLSVNEMPNVKIDTAVSTPRNAICSQYVWKKGGDLFNLDDAGFSYYIEGGENRLFVKDLRYSDAASFKAAMDGVTLVYELATPTTIQLTPTDLQMLKGYNNISSDAGGDMSITYKADRLAAIEAALAELQNT